MGLQNKNVTIHGEFSTLFDVKEYTDIFKSNDELTVALKTHLILEQFLNLWCSKISNTKDLFKNIGFLAFTSKLEIAKNLGFDIKAANIFKEFNAIRNKFSHVRKYKFSDKDIQSLRIKIDDLAKDAKILPCDQFFIFEQGHNSAGENIELNYRWDALDNRGKAVILFIVLMMKLSYCFHLDVTISS